jgi:polyribonucleotide nucleotidyltransferase
MDFKVAGTQNGITGIQLDIKLHGITEAVVRGALDQAREARRDILKTMLMTLRAPRKTISERAPRLLQVRINPEKIGLLIGPGGKTIRAIQEETGAKLDVEDDGTVSIAHAEAAGAEEAKRRVEALTQEIKVGNIYEGKVSSIKEFGAFIEIAPGRDGLCHISELDVGYVGRVEDVVRVGDKVTVKVIAIDDQDRVKLSRKVLLAPKDGEVGADVGNDRGDRRPTRENRGDRGERNEARRERGESRRERETRTSERE